MGKINISYDISEQFEINIIIKRLDKKNKKPKAKTVSKKLPYEPCNKIEILII
jgi:hypothetical protein